MSPTLTPHFAPMFPYTSVVVFNQIYDIPRLRYITYKFCRLQLYNIICCCLLYIMTNGFGVHVNRSVVYSSFFIKYHIIHRRSPSTGTFVGDPYLSFKFGAVSTGAGTTREREIARPPS